jgi:hypothetical protein
MELRYSPRIKLGMALIVFLTLVPAIWQAMSALSSFHTLPRTDAISQYEKRFRGVADVLPANQIVFYRDDLDKSVQHFGRCRALELAQYSLAPTVLDVLDSRCDHLTGDDKPSARKSGLVLENVLDPQGEPYLLDLFPITFLQPRSNRSSSTKGGESGADQIVPLKDFGHGVRLWPRRDP